MWKKAACAGLATDLRPFYRGSLALTVLVVAYLAFAPLDEPPLFSNDKSNHLLAFAVMAWLSERGWPGRASAPVRWGALLGYALLIEWVQRGLPYREFSWLDVLADVLGMLAYASARALVSRLAAWWRSGIVREAGKEA